jgi:hypothetical protein
VRPRIKLTGYDNAAKVVDIFASDLVDIVYVDDVGPDGIEIIGDDCVDLSDPGDYTWATSLIECVLRDHGIVGVRMEPSSDAP